MPTQLYLRAAFANKAQCGKGKGVGRWFEMFERKFLRWEKKNKPIWKSSVTEKIFEGSKTDKQ